MRALVTREPANLLYSPEATLTSARTTSPALARAFRRWKLPALLPSYGAFPVAYEYSWRQDWEKGRADF